MNFGINSTRCSDDGKIAFLLCLANSLPFSLKLVKFIPNFTPSRAITYTNSLITDLISAWTNYTSEQLLSYLENKSLFVTCFVKINEEIIEIAKAKN